MKKSIMIFAVILCAGSQTIAQETDLKKIYTDITTTINSALLTRKGSYEISGSVFYDRMKTEYKDRLSTQLNYPTEIITETFQAEPGIGYFFIDNLSAGLLVSYLNIKQEGGRTEQTLAGPIVKKYFGEKEWRPYLFSSYLFCSGDILEGGEWDLGAGLLYHVTGNFGMMVQVKYGLLFPDDDLVQEMSRIFVGIGIVNFIL